MGLDRKFMETIEKHIPPSFFIRVIEEFEEDYSRSTSEPFELFEEPEAHDLMGDERRARTETSLASVSKQFAHHGITADAKLNPTCSHYHREVASGPIILTASFVPSPNFVVREARFRETLAMSRQLSLLEGGDPGGDRLYGVLLHGVKRIGLRLYRDALGFFQLAIPNRACNGYDAIYNLAERYADTEIDPKDVAAAMEAGVPIDPVRRPSALLREYRRKSNSAE